MRAALKAAGMSSEAMARRLGVTGATVRGWYLERREPDLASLRAFSSAAGCSLLWLLEGDQAPEELGEWALAFAELVAAGVDPAAALTQVSGGAPAAFRSTAAQRRSKAVRATASASEQPLSCWSRVMSASREGGVLDRPTPAA